MTTIIERLSTHSGLGAPDPAPIPSPFSNASCPPGTFPAQWLLDAFVREHVAPFFSAGFIRGARVPFIDDDEEFRTMGVGSYPIGAWVGSLTDREAAAVSRAVWLVSSSLSFEFASDVSRDADGTWLFGAAVPTPFDGWLVERPLLTTWFRWLPEALQRENGIPDSGLVTSSSLVLNVYGVDTEIPQIYSNLHVQPYQPVVGTWTPDHPLRKMLFDGGVLSALVTAWNPDEQLQRSFVFPLRWGPATRIDAEIGDLRDILNAINEVDDDGNPQADAPVGIPLFGLPEAGREAMLGVASSLIEQGYKSTFGWRDRGDGPGRPRTVAGRGIRRLAFAMVAPMLGPAGWFVAPSQTDIRRGLFTLAKAFAQIGLSTHPDGMQADQSVNIDRQGHTLNEALAVVLSHQQAAVRGLDVLGSRVWRDPSTSPA